MNIIHNDSIRKLIVSFGNLFSQIPILRYEDNENEVQRFIVSITYAAKEQYIHRLNDDPELNSRVNIVIPTLSYEMMGMSYDSSRKQNTNIKNFANTPEGIRSQYMPVPYDFNIDLNLYARTFEDAHQVVEHIVSYFTPDYTIKVNYIPEMNIVKEVPIILNSVDRDVEYEGDRESSTRRIVFTFHFTLKGYIFGKPSDLSNKLITHTITNILSYPNPEGVFEFTLNPTGTGNYKSGEFVYQGLSLKNSDATAKVIEHDELNNILFLTNLYGDFNSSTPLVGSITNTKYYFTSSSPSSNNEIVKIDVTVEPPNANVNSNWTANTSITEFP